MYDWLPSPGSVFGDRSTKVVLSTDGCSKDPNVADAIAVISDENCDFYDKVYSEVFIRDSLMVGGARSFFWRVFGDKSVVLSTDGYSKAQCSRCYSSDQ